MGVVPLKQRCREAIVFSVARVGETITFSAGILIATACRCARSWARALSVTGTTVTSAGLVLAGTFGVLAIVGSGSAGAQSVRTIVDVGVGLALGVLMDTFLVRTLLVPSAAVLIGRWNWWPSRLCRQQPVRRPTASFTA